MPLKVNGQVIPEAAITFELDRLVRFYSDHMSKEQIAAQMGVLRARAREQVIGTKLLLDEAMRLDINVPSDEVDKRVAKIAEKAGGHEKFEKLLQTQGQSIESFRAGVETGRRADLLVERITAGIADPTEGEMRAHYNSHQNEYARPEQVQVQHILIRPESDDEDARIEAGEEAEGIRQKILDGADFAALAAEHSDCPSGKRSKGSLGWIERGMLVPAFDQAVFSMEIDGISEVIATPLGYHVVHKTGHEPARPASYEDVKDRIREFLRHVRRGEVIAVHIAELKAKARIEDTAG